MSKMSFAVQTNGWEILAGNVRKYAEELPGTDAYREDLAKAAAEARRYRNQHLQLRSEMLRAARRMREAIARGEEAERRLRRLLQGIHGATDPRLLRYGIQPRRKRRRPAEEPEAAAPNAPGEPAGGETEPAEAPPAPKPRSRRSRL